MARSKSYPYINLRHAIQVIDRATKTGKSWTREQFANFGTKETSSSVKSGAFIRRVSALKEYGLIETAKDNISLTSLGEKIVKPIHEDEKEVAILESFYSAAQFKGVVEDLTFRPDESFSDTDLSTLAVSKHGITRDAQQKFVKTLVDSATFAGVFIKHDNGKYTLNKSKVPSLSEEVRPPTKKEKEEEGIPPETTHKGVDNPPRTQKKVNQDSSIPYVETSVTASRVKLVLDVPVSKEALDIVLKASKLAAGLEEGGND